MVVVVVVVVVVLAVTVAVDVAIVLAALVPLAAVAAPAPPSKHLLFCNFPVGRSQRGSQCRLVVRTTYVCERAYATSRLWVSCGQVSG